MDKVQKRIMVKCNAREDLSTKWIVDALCQHPGYRSTRTYEGIYLDKALYRCPVCGKGWEVGYPAYDRTFGRMAKKEKICKLCKIKKKEK